MVIPHRVWKDAGGREVLEEYVITGMGHGTPLSAGGGFGEALGAFMLDVGISSTRAIARFWEMDKNRPRKTRRHSRLGSPTLQSLGSQLGPSRPPAQLAVPSASKKRSKTHLGLPE